MEEKENLIDIEETIEEKQEFLKKEIIDKQLDQDSFLEFCIQRKENGDDLNNWTLKELQDIVMEFKSSMKEIKENQEKQRLSKMEEKKKKLQEEVLIDSVEKIEKIQKEIPKKQKNEEIIICKKLEPTILSGVELKVQIKNPKEMENGIFSINYVLYEIITSKFNWKVSRRFSDFLWLRNILIKMHPGHIIPPMPNKKIGSRRFDYDFVMKRMKFLKIFINRVCENETFKSNEALVAFLSFENRTKFESKMNELSSFIPSNYIEEIKTLDGTVTITHEAGNEKYYSNIKRYFHIQTQIYNKLNYNLKNFYDNMLNVIDNISDIQQNFEILHLLNTKVLMKSPIKNTFKELEEFFKNWKTILITQNELVKSYLKDFYKYIKIEGLELLEFEEKREELQSNFLSEQFNLEVKKEKAFNSKDLDKMEIDENKTDIDREKLLTNKEYAFKYICHRDNEDFKFLSNMLGYYNKMLITEVKKMLKRYCKIYIKNLKSFNADFYITLNKVR